MTVAPPRAGLGPSRLRLPADWDKAGGGATILDYLLARFPADPDRVRDKVGAGDVLDASGDPITSRTPYAAGSHIYIYRDHPVERRIPFELTVLYRDEAIVVVDKPHFLATTPRGSFVTETALVRLRRGLGLPHLVPAHRLDRLTAGVLLFTVHPGVRSAYHDLFATGAVEKTYEAVAGHRPELAWPRTIRSRIIKDRKVLTATEVPGEPNAETYAELTSAHGEWARYRLLPRTGKTHQLRVHLSSQGVPIVGDPLYPQILPYGPDDFSKPLRLLARSLAFTDPLSGRPHLFTSSRRLDLP